MVYYIIIIVYLFIVFIVCRKYTLCYTCYMLQHIETPHPSTKDKRGASDLYDIDGLYFTSSMMQMPTRFQAGSEKMSPTPWPMAEMREGEIPYLSTRILLTASARRWESFRLYSGVGFGTMGGYVKGDGHPSHGFQFTPVGLSYGKRFYGFAELGMGWMFSLSRAGIGIRF